MYFVGLMTATGPEAPVSIAFKSATTCCTRGDMVPPVVDCSAATIVVTAITVKRTREREMLL